MKWNYDWQEEPDSDRSRGPIAIGQIVPAVLARYGLDRRLFSERAASAPSRGAQAVPAPRQPLAAAAVEPAAVKEV
jgi:hypothetical protein